MAWNYTTRTLNDGVRITTNPVDRMPDWIRVDINAHNGYPMYSGCMPVFDAFQEIPYQLDRAREFEREYQKLR